ncbi:MAG TPA: hypothetical protein VJL38_03465 [Patescibacteria group bacterium]|nr:hypothetical protein [Patescibacteria group bacterium]
MKLLDFFRKTEKADNPSRFSEFFLHASEKEKEKVFKEVARKANEEQREVFMRANLKTKAG